MSNAPYPLYPVLMIDDDPAALAGMEMILAAAGIDHVISCRDSRVAREIMYSQELDAVLLDLDMPHIRGEILLEELVRNFPTTPVIIITGTDHVETAIRCMKSGASDYLVKPVEEGSLTAALSRMIEIRELRRENSSLRHYLLWEKLDFPEAFSDFKTNNKKIRQIFQYIEAIRHAGQPIMITGETGVGKEIIARSIHKLCCPNEPFVSVNIAGLDNHVFSDTLFGHKKGAFTGAEHPRKGLVEKAGNGILFLDEIGDLSHGNQVKLLRLLQEREFFPLGSDVAKPMNARVVAATHREIKKMQGSHRFRKDLFYRLCTHHVHIPPLRERMDDLPVLFYHFLEKICLELGTKEPEVPDNLIPLLKTYDFPGNARELESMVNDAVTHQKNGVLSTSLFEKKILDAPGPDERAPLSVSNGPLSLPDKLPTIDAMIDILIAEAMKRSNNKQTLAAKLLGISQPALSKRLKKKRG